MKHCKVLIGALSTLSDEQIDLINILLRDAKDGAEWEKDYQYAQ